jgi:hypothetical protein
MYVFKKIKDDEQLVNSQTVYSVQSLSTASLDVTSQLCLSASSDTSQSAYWNYLSINYYSSGSNDKTSSNQEEQDKYNSPFNSDLYWNDKHPQYRNKFHNTASLISISSYHYGDRMKSGSFSLTFPTMSKQIKIVDDGWGNLYSTNPTITQSNESFSSSKNYIGNIMYDHGIVMITETGSWSGSVKYTDIIDGNYSMKFDSQQELYTLQLKVVLEENEFNHSTNVTSRGFVSSSVSEGVSAPDSDTDPYKSGVINSKFTSSNWSPYITAIGFYEENKATSKPILIAKLSKPIKKPKDSRLIFQVKYDL